MGWDGLEMVGGVCCNRHLDVGILAKAIVPGWVAVRGVPASITNRTCVGKPNGPDR